MIQESTGSWRKFFKIRSADPFKPLPHLRLAEERSRKVQNFANRYLSNSAVDVYFHNTLTRAEYFEMLISFWIAFWV